MMVRLPLIKFSNFAYFQIIAGTALAKGKDLFTIPILAGNIEF